MNGFSSRLLAMAGLSLSLCAGAALAQDRSGPPPGPPGASGAPPRSPASQADQLRSTLRLRADQEGALQAFVQAMAPPPGVIERMRQQDRDFAAMPTPRRLDLMLARMDEMRGLMVAHVGATKRFYAQLPPEQQRTFDALQSGGQGRGGGG
ncbi:MAG: Spy/CpxP family protein refolding chaperone, partial [Caulobacteraceae bacterium]